MFISTHHFFLFLPLPPLAFFFSGIGTPAQALAEAYKLDVSAKEENNEDVVVDEPE